MDPRTNKTRHQVDHSSPLCSLKGPSDFRTRRRKKVRRRRRPTAEFPPDPNLGLGSRAGNIRCDRNIPPGRSESGFLRHGCGERRRWCGEDRGREDGGGGVDDKRQLPRQDRTRMRSLQNHTWFWSLHHSRRFGICSFFQILGCCLNWFSAITETGSWFSWFYCFPNLVCANFIT